MQRPNSSQAIKFGKSARFFMTLISVAVAAQPALAQIGVPITATYPLTSTAYNDTREDDSPRLATDGHGQWLAVWESKNPTADIGLQDSDIYVARSADNGQTWTIPAPLNNDAATDLYADFNPDIATDGKGNWLAVWYGIKTSTGGDTEVWSARSTDNGQTWTDPAPVNSNALSDSGGDQSPRVYTSGKGTWIAVWESFDSLGNTIGTDADILFSRSTDNGATWSPVAPLNTNAGIDTQRDNDPSLTTDGQGNWVAVWYSKDTLGGTIGSDLDILVSRSSDDGVTWSAPAPLNSNAVTDTGDDYQPTIATDRQGHWTVAWICEDTLGGTKGSDPDIVVARSADNGLTWTAPKLLQTDGGSDTGEDYAPSIATDSHGEWIATWESTDDLAGGASTDSDILISRSSDNGLTWTPPARLNSNAATDTGTDRRPAVATDALGHWVVLWDSNEVLDGLGTDMDILAARFAIPDCNQNGIADTQDISLGLSQDCNANGVPDECESDRDGDHLIDACDTCPDDATNTCTPGPAGGGAACGAGLCGASSASVLPLTLLGLHCMKRRRR